MYQCSLDCRLVLVHARSHTVTLLDAQLTNNIGIDIIIICRHTFNITLIVGQYRYMQDLLQLQSKHSPFPLATEVLTEPPPVTRLIHNWQGLLNGHQDREFREYILSGLRGGFRIGFSWLQPLSSAKRNIPSAYAHPEAVDEYIQKELAAGNFIGPLPSPTLSNGQSIHISRIGVIPKGHDSGKWRVITDLPSGECE